MAQQHVHILGICGTFMAGIALIARELGFTVSGSDEHVYPPMSLMLKEAKIEVKTGYRPEHLDPSPDLVIVGNVLSRGNLSVEYILNKKIPYISGPQWLREHVLQNRHVLAIAGTHGKTTTTSLLTWILEQAELSPGYLIGGVAKGLKGSAQLGQSRYFVIEADEYDTAFFDKQPKFMHYRPTTLVINNIEFDHGDIFADLEAIKTQFRYLLRTVPGEGSVIYSDKDHHVNDVVSQGCWSNKITIMSGCADWQAQLLAEDGSAFIVYYQEKKYGEVHWNLLGQHNVHNALAAMAAASTIGVKPEIAISALNQFQGVKRRLEVVIQAQGVTVYDDFAHHPTAIATTLMGLRKKIGKERIIAVLQFASNTMKRGQHDLSEIAEALSIADFVLILKPDWDLSPLIQKLKIPSQTYTSVNEIIANLIPALKSGDHVVIMSNKDFGGLQQKLIQQMK